MTPSGDRDSSHNQPDYAPYVENEFEPVRLDLLGVGLRGHVQFISLYPHDQRLRCTLTVNDASVGEVTIDQQASPSGRLRLLADFTQGLVIENVRVDGHTIDWPRCIIADHHHPMTVGAEEGPANWRCPTDTSITVPIGHYTKSTPT